MGSAPDIPENVEGPQPSPGTSRSLLGRAKAADPPAWARLGPPSPPRGVPGEGGRGRAGRGGGGRAVDEPRRRPGGQVPGAPAAARGARGRDRVGGAFGRPSHPGRSRDLSVVTPAARAAGGAAATGSPGG